MNLSLSTFLKRPSLRVRANHVRSLAFKAKAIQDPANLPFVFSETRYKRARRLR